MTRLPPNRTLLIWAKNELKKGNRVKASKIFRAMEKMNRLAEAHMHQQFTRR